MSVTFFYICKRKFTIINKTVDNKKVIKWTIYNHYQLKVRDVKLY